MQDSLLDFMLDLTEQDMLLCSKQYVAELCLLLHTARIIA